MDCSSQALGSRVDLDRVLQWLLILMTCLVSSCARRLTFLLYVKHCNILNLALLWQRESNDLKVKIPKATHSDCNVFKKRVKPNYLQVTCSNSQIKDRTQALTLSKCLQTKPGNFKEFSNYVACFRHTAQHYDLTAWPNSQEASATYFDWDFHNCTIGPEVSRHCEPLGAPMTPAPAMWEPESPYLCTQYIGAGVTECW